MDKKLGVIYVDLDGTLAEYDEFRGYEHIGKPIPEMVAFVKMVLKKGYQVKIFTARVAEPTAVYYIREWIKEHIGCELIVTNIKGQDGFMFLDDKAYHVVKNTGKVCCEDVANKINHELEAKKNAV